MKQFDIDMITSDIDIKFHTDWHPQNIDSNEIPIFLELFI
jgi:hypothetical protein